MEFEFDKEMDAFLRKVRPPRGSTAAAGPHLDADAIAAFAENALPAKTRSLYSVHLADCDRCRRLLSQTISAGEAAEPASAAVTALAPAVASVPWYSGLLGARLALAFGAMALVLGSGLVYLMLRNSQSDLNASVREPANIPVSATGAYGNANVAGTPALEQSSANSTSANVAGEKMQANGGALQNTAAAPAAPLQTPAAAANSALGKVASTREADLDSAKEEKALKPAASAPIAGQPAPPSPVMNDDKTVADESPKDARDNTSLARKRATEDRYNTRDLPATAAKSGPTRSGPVQMNSQNQTQSFEMSVHRTVGGKTFSNRSGAWYDTAFNGQPTTNVRRGTDEFKALPGGLRSIANELGGVVVVVWKSKAYRIQ